MALRRSYSSSQADAVPVMSDEVLIKLFLLAVLLFFLEEAPLSFECSLNQSSRSSSIFIPLMLEAADLSPSLSLLNRKKNNIFFFLELCFALSAVRRTTTNPLDLFSRVDVPFLHVFFLTSLSGVG